MQSSAVGDTIGPPKKAGLDLGGVYMSEKKRPRPIVKNRPRPSENRAGGRGVKSRRT